VPRFLDVTNQAAARAAIAAEGTGAKNQANGYCGLDGSGKVAAAQLPSYVDDVLEFANLAAFPATGETSKIFVALDTGDSYRWSGSVYIRISQRVTASGVTDSTAVGRAVLTAADAAAARAAIGADTGGYAAPAIDFLGDSITAQNGGNTPVSNPSGAVYPNLGAHYESRGFAVYALMILGQRLRCGTNFGIGGQTTTAIRARLVDVLASPHRYVHVYAGVNDIGQGLSLATTQSNLKAIYTDLIAAGKIVTTATVGSTLTISGAAILAGISAGATTFTSAATASPGDVLVLGSAGTTETVTVASVSGTSTFTITLTAPTANAHLAGAPFRNTTKLTRLHAVNQWIIDFCQGRYVDPDTGTVVVNSGKTPYLVNWHELVADPATGKPVGALQADGTITTPTINRFVSVVDGTHPGQDLAHRMGHALAVVLDRIVPPLPIQVGDNTDTSNLAPNPRCIGNTAGVATGFTLTAASGTITATASKVARTDGVPGEMQQVAIGPGNTGQVQLSVCDVSGLTFTGNDSYVGEVEFETDPTLVVFATAAGIPLRLRLNSRNTSGEVESTTTPFNATGADGAGSIWDSDGVLQTKPLQISASATRLQLTVASTNVDTGTFRVKSVRIRKVTP
jgi:hypothetical protein